MSAFFQHSVVAETKHPRKTNISAKGESVREEYSRRSLSPCDLGHSKEENELGSILIGKEKVFPV